MKRLTDITKRDIYELFRDGCIVEDFLISESVKYPYYGRLEETDFLERLYDLENMRSNDSRYENAKGDIFIIRLPMTIIQIVGSSKMKDLD